MPVLNIMDECAICLAEIENLEDLKVIKCEHKFHRECFDVWGNNGTDYVSCPMCRAIYRKKYLHYNPPHFVVCRPKPKDCHDVISEFKAILIIILIAFTAGIGGIFIGRYFKF